MASRDEVIAISNAAADLEGIPRLLLLACGVAEADLVPTTRRPSAAANDQDFWPDVSGGVWQQTVRWDPEYQGGAGYPGEAEIERVLALQYDVDRSAKLAATNLAAKWALYQPDMLATLSAYNWPQGKGQPASPATEANYQRGLTEAAALLGGIVPDAPSTTPAPVYDPTTPVVPQNHDWDCAEQSTLWALTAFGRQPSDAWMEASMLSSGVESTDEGLLVGDGSQLAAWITEQYDEFGYAAQNNVSVSFDDVVSVAGASPVLMGGHRWGAAGHWVGVRGYDRAADELLLANPADGYAGISQRMSRQQFAQVAPCAMVVVTWGGSAAPAGQPDAGAPAPTYAAPGEVGSGLLELMAADGTAPAMPSTFLPLGKTPSTVEECQGLNGTIYRWHLPTGQHWRFPAA